MKIAHIDEVMPHVAGRTDFVVAKRDGYVVIDYIFQDLDTFAEPIRRECRGIKFDAATGNTLARPFHKFFNIGERAETQPESIDFTRPHWIMSKVDGSMIHPMIVNGALVLSTRMGRTKHAMTAERHLTATLSSWFEECLTAGWTPICEWIAPDNRIIIKYPDSKLVLLAIRNTVSGDYMGPDAVSDGSRRAGIEAVDLHPSWDGDARAFMASVAALKDEEGYVIRFADGLWLKCKAVDYVQKSSAKSAITLEKNALAAILSGTMDDVKPLLADEDLRAIEAYERGVLAGVAETATRITALVAAGANADQKTFAVTHMAGVEPQMRGMAFAVRKGADARATVRATILKSTGSQTDVDAARSLFGGTAWTL